MKQIYTLLSVSFSLAIILLPGELFSQKQTFDLATYIAPKAWKKQTTESTIQFIKEDSAKAAYCIISLLKSIPGTGDAKGDFDAAWETIIKEMVTVESAPEMQPLSENNGWKIQSGYAAFEREEEKGVVFLITASGGEKMMNLIILTNSDIYETNIADFISSINLKKQVATPQTAVSNNSSLVGLWGISTTTASYYNTSMNEGSIVRQYQFNANGTYSFTVKTFKYLLENILLTRETGTYKISGNTISVVPLNSVTQAWTRKSGEDWGKLVSSQKRQLETTTYQYSIEDYGIGLVLEMRSGNVTKRDGDYNNGKKDAWVYPAKAASELIKLPQGVN